MLTQAEQKQATRILMVEDNKMDSRLMTQAIRQMPDWRCTIEVVDDGEKAIKFLGCRDGYSLAVKPDLVILDLQLPRCDGTEVLRFIRGDAALRSLLVFIFSSSPVDIAQERMRRVQVEADSYFEKPNTLGTYASVAAEIRDGYQLASDGRSGVGA